MDLTVLLCSVQNHYPSFLCFILQLPSLHILITNLHCKRPLPFKQWDKSSRINPEWILMLHKPTTLFYFKPHSKHIMTFGFLQSKVCQPAGTWKRNSDIWTPSPRLRLCSCCAEPPALQPHWEKAYPLQGTVGKPSNTQAEMFFSGKQQEVQAALSTGGQCRASHTPRAPCKAVHTRGQLEGHRYPIVY